MKRKTKNELAIAALLLLLEKLDVMAMQVIHIVIPMPQIRKRIRRPKRSIVNREMKEERNFHVMAQAAKIRVIESDSFRFCWKSVVTYVEMTWAPVIWIQNCSPIQSMQR